MRSFARTVPAVLLLAAAALGQTVSTVWLDQSIRSDGVSRGPADGLLVCEGWNGSRVFRVGFDGSVVDVAQGLAGPIQAVLDVGDSLWVSQYGAASVARLAPDGDLAGTVAVGSGPSGLIGAADGSWLVSRVPNSGSGDVRRYQPGGEVEVFASGGTVSRPVGMAFDPQGRLYAANLYDGRITRISPDGSQELFATVPSTGSFRVGHLVWAMGGLFATALSENRLYRIDADGAVRVFAGSGAQGQEDGPALEATFTAPNGLAASTGGDSLFVFPALNAHDSFRVITGFDETRADAPAAAPSGFSLLPVAPNPFNPTTRVGLRLDRSMRVRLSVRDLLGRSVDTLIDGPLAAGVHERTFDAGSLPSGPYWLLLESEAGREARPMALIR